MEKLRRTHHYQEEEENYEQIFDKIMDHLDLNEENYQNDPKYLNLLEGLNKKKELQAIIQ